MKKTKKLIGAVCLAIAMAMVVPSFVPSLSGTETVEAASKVKLNKTKATLYTGKILQLKVKGTKKKVTWKSSNKKVATVSSKGKVAAMKKGKATITAKVAGKKYACKITVKEAYGSVSGNVSYYYNRYQGNKADTGAYVILIPKSGVAATANLSLYSSSEELQKYNVFVAKVDGVGNYKINHVPIGEYQVLMISSKTTSGEWFKTNDTDSYYKKIAQNFYPKYLNKKTATSFASSVMFNKYTIKSITIYKNEDTYLSHDFGITYI